MTRLSVYLFRDCDSNELADAIADLLVERGLGCTDNESDVAALIVRDHPDLPDDDASMIAAVVRDADMVLVPQVAAR